MSIPELASEDSEDESEGDSDSGSDFDPDADDDPKSGGDHSSGREKFVGGNSEERITHIAVERNRRKQMNEYLVVLRSLMPRSYVKRDDQASIVGGAINFLKELEHIIQSIKGQKKTIEQQSHENGFNNSSSSPFADFFMFPQYSTCAPQSNTCYPANPNQSRAMADVEVTLVDSHVNIKIMLKKQHEHVTKMVVGIQNLDLNILHLNVSTLDHLVLVSVSVKVEEGCELKTVDEIAAAMNQLSLKIQAEAVL
ncbi:unnamed protein product [Vicia faba]|uniref:BHLH domain-containing protein n=1 Tax=Vicia faba TaxID=3906 RepID=A0AAV0YII0_VICFA|nr:unnamed protein product [Vicia faba]